MTDDDDDDVVVVVDGDDYCVDDLEMYNLHLADNGDDEDRLELDILGNVDGSSVVMVVVIHQYIEPW